jgi:hypothetical protein
MSMATRAKAKAKKRATVKNLAPSDAKRVKGGLPAVQLQQQDLNSINFSQIAAKFQKV